MREWLRLLCVSVHPISLCEVYFALMCHFVRDVVPALCRCCAEACYACNTPSRGILEVDGPMSYLEVGVSLVWLGAISYTPITFPFTFSLRALYTLVLLFGGGSSLCRYEVVL